jgi:glutathione S-transferase
MRRILWGRATSSNVMKVIWTLEELLLPYERIDVGGSFGKTDTADYRAMNPTGLVPTLQEDDFTLWESNAICRYLCHAHAPHSKLWPGAARSCQRRPLDGRATDAAGPADRRRVLGLGADRARQARHGGHQAGN